MAPTASPGPTTNFEGKPAPEVGQIVKWNGTHWVDALGRPRDEHVKFSLPDKDVFVIDAMASPPRQLSGAGGFFQGVGTILYTMAVNPVSGKVYVANTDANNMDRFEGPGTFAGHSLRGHLHESRITVLTPGGGVAPRHLNKHINYNSCCAPTPNAESVRSLALPQEMAVTGQRRDALRRGAGLEQGRRVLDGAARGRHLRAERGRATSRSSGGGPTGPGPRRGPQASSSCMTRFDNAISIVNTDDAGGDGARARCTTRSRRAS